MAMIENANDLILVLTASGALFASVMAAIRMSKCYFIRCCFGCLEIKRFVKNKDKEEVEEPNIEV